MNMDQCIDNCTECHRVCLETAVYCLTKGGKHAEARHVRLLLDCAQICAVSADFMARRSPYHTHVCAECAEICNACAAFCEAHPDPDGQMKRCAEACRACARSCEQMGSAAH